MSLLSETNANFLHGAKATKLRYDYIIQFLYSAEK